MMAASKPSNVNVKDNQDTEDTFRKRDGTTGSAEGPDYEMKIIMFIISQCSKQNLSFKIKSNVDSPEKNFDDIVVEFTEKCKPEEDTKSRHMFLQAKRLTGKKASIFTKTKNSFKSGKNNFPIADVQTWFQSFKILHEQCGDEDFEMMYFTTVDIEGCLKENFVISDSMYEQVLIPRGHANYRGKIYGLHYQKCVEALNEQCSDETKIKNFCRQFKIFALQPENIELECIIKYELKMLYPETKERIYNKAFNFLRQWWMATRNVPVLKTDIFVKAECEELFNFPSKTQQDFLFTANILRSAIDKNAHVTSFSAETDNLILHTDLVRQCLEGESVYLIHLRDFIQRRNRLFTYFKTVTSLTYVVVKIDELNDVETQRNILTEILAVYYKVLTNLRLVFLIAKSVFSNELISENFPSNHQKIPLNYSNLSEEAQKIVLEHKINYQGQETNFASVKLSVKALQKLIDEEMLVDIRLKKPVIIGDAPLQLNFQANTYIKRNLHIYKFKNPREFLTSKDIKDKYFISASEEEKIQVLSKWDLGESYLDQVSPNITFVCPDQSNFEKSGKAVKEKSIHLLRIINNQLIWLQTMNARQVKDDITLLIEKDVPEEGFIAELVHQSFPTITLIPHDAGMGKTLLAHSLQQQLISLKYWTVLVPLHKYLDINVGENTKEINNKISPEEVLGNILPRSRYLQTLANAEKVVVLLDGLDEVAPKHTELVLRVIDTLCKMNVYRIIVLTRSHIADEVKICRNAITVMLQKFSEKDVETFLKKYFESLKFLGTHSKPEQLKYFITGLVNLIFGKNLQYWTDTAGVPLQTKIIAELFTKKCKYYLKTESLDFLPSEADMDKDYYHEYIQHKFDIYMMEKKKLPPSFIEEHSKKLWKKFCSSHTYCANELIFPETNVFKHWNSKSRTDFEKHTMINYGIIAILNKESIEFIHRSFAEYFCALFIKNILINGRTLEQMKLIFNTVFVADQYKLIRKFLNQKINNLTEKAGFCNGICTEKDFQCAVFNAESRTIILHMAFFEGNLRLAAMLLTYSAENWSTALATLVNSRDKYGRTPLHLAADAGYTEIVQLLLERGVDCEAREIDGDTPLYLAADRGHTDVVKLLLDQVLNLEYPNKNSCTPLHIAAYHGHISVVKVLVGKGCKMDIKDVDGNIPLHLAAQKGAVETVQFLVQQGGYVNEKNNDGDTPLHKNAFMGHVETIQVLVELGANVNEKDNYGDTPLRISSTSGEVEGVRVLVELGASVNERSNHGNTPLHGAAAFGNVETVELLLNLSASINERDVDGDTPLHDAAWNDKIDSARVLVERGADINARNLESKTPLSLACEKGFSQMVEFLQSRGAIE